MADVTVKWDEERQFVASGSGGHSIVLDAPGGLTTWHGFKPSELLLAAVGGCTAIDVVEILRKQRQRVSDVRISAHGEQAADPPMPFATLDPHYEVHGAGVDPSFPVGQRRRSAPAL